MAQRSTLETLGKFHLTIDDRRASPPPTNKSRALLAFLVSNRGHDVARERLIETFWADFDPERAREGLRTALSSIRHSLRSVEDSAAELLSASKSVVQWSASTGYDADRFAGLAQSESLEDKRESLALYRGDFLEGNYEEWAVRERERLSAAYEDALAAIVARTSDPCAARLLLVRNPYDENAYASLIDAEIQGNRPESAAALLSRCRAAMSEAGLETSATFEQRFAGVLELPNDDEARFVVPFVARASELQFFHRAFSEREGFVALVIGEPGIGKTALSRRAEELARAAGRRTLTVRCTEDPKQLSAWRSLYQRLTGKTIEDLSARSTDVASSVAREIVESFEKPCALFVDDAHLLTGDSLATLAKVVDSARPAGHGIAMMLRPEARERIESLVNAFSHETIVLGPLEREDIQTALAITIDAETPELADMLYARSGGHPLFFVALLQSLVQKHALRRERGRWRIVRALDDRLELPQDLRASIDSRLRAAGDDAAVVACALALEPSSNAEDLAAALDYAEPRVLDALDRLMGFALISEAPVSGGFRFVHDMVREVSATVLNPGRRVALHRAFARRFEQTSSSDATLRRARHLRAAGMAIPAATAYLQAVEAALLHYGVRDAAGYCIEAISALERIEPGVESDALLAQLYRSYARAAANAGDFEFALNAVDNAVQRARALAQPVETAKSLVVRSALHGIAGDVDVQQIDASEAESLAMQTGESALAAQALVESAAASRASGNVEEAIRCALEAVRLADRVSDTSALFSAYDELLNTHVSWWHFRDAAACFRDARSVAESLGSNAEAKLCCLRAAFEYLCDRPDEALAQISSALRRIEPLRVLPLVAFTAQFLRGTLACRHCKWDEALDAAALCGELGAVATLPRYANAVTTIRIAALTGRNFEGDLNEAQGQIDALEDLPPNGILSLGSCKPLLSAHLSARLRSENLRKSLRGALDALEENAKRVPLDCDRAFTSLAEAAEIAGDAVVRDRALSRAAHYRATRVEAIAGAAPEQSSLRPLTSAGSKSAPPR